MVNKIAQQEKSAQGQGLRESFWAQRAKNYEKLEWAIKGGYLHAFLEAGDFQAQDHVLDIGTGTGLIAHTISPHVARVVGIDIAPSMLSHALKNKNANEEFMCMDAARLIYPDGTFSKVTARMVFHHILENTEQVMKECRRVLKPGGKMIFSEGVPPTHRVKQFYTEMFKLKEERLTFMEEDLEVLMRQAGFFHIEKIIYWMRSASVRNWLKNSGLREEVQEKIFALHLALHPEGKKDYSMVIKDNDCFIDMKFIILVGEK